MSFLICIWGQINRKMKDLIQGGFYMEYKVERLLVNFKTLEEFKKFKEYGIQELSMLEDLETNIIENNSESPFFGVYFGDSLVARMSLYKKRKNSTVILRNTRLSYLMEA